MRYGPTALLLWAGPGLARTRREPGADVDPAGEVADAGAPTDASTGSADEPRSRRGRPGRRSPIPGLNRVHLVPLDRIRYLEADGDHVRVHTTDGEHRVRATLSDLEREGRAESAPSCASTARTWSTWAHVREVQPFQHGDWVAVMSDGAELRIPRTRRRALDRILGRGAPA